MIKKLLKLAGDLDAKGYYKMADEIDGILNMAVDEVGESMYNIGEDFEYPPDSPEAEAEAGNEIVAMIDILNKIKDKIKANEPLTEDDKIEYEGINQDLQEQLQMYLGGDLYSVQDGFPSQSNPAFGGRLRTELKENRPLELDKAVEKGIEFDMLPVAEAKKKG